MTMPNTRQWHGLIFLSATALISIALYFQYIKGLEPCPLCVLQRVAFVCIGVVSLIALIHNPKAWGTKIYAILGALLAIAGGAAAARQVWLQHLPKDQLPTCASFSLDYLIEMFPLQEAIQMIFQGSAECAKVVWTFLGMSIPEWTLIAFIGYLGLFLYLMIARVNTAL